MLSIDEYRIMVHAVRDPEFETRATWHDCGEGTWDRQEDAVAFAHEEIGVPWVVTNGKGEPVAYGDAMGLQEQRDD